MYLQKMRRLTVVAVFLAATTAACEGGSSGVLGLGRSVGGGGGTGADTLQFTVPPSTAAATNIITPAIEVTVLDSLRQPDSSFTTGVTIAIGTNPSGATLSGTTTVTPVNGIARFGDLSIDRTGTGYTLRASASGATPTTSSTFNITP